MSSVLGALFRVSTFGESHGPGVGVVIDGCPPKTVIDPAKIQAELDRRKPGQSRIVTQRKEADEFEILSGVEGGLSTGAPLAFLVRNTDQRSRDYEEMKRKFRPSHADFTYQAKFGIRTVEGGGRSSARETVSRVIAGAVAKSFLSRWNIEILAYVEKIHEIQALVDPSKLTIEQIEASIVRCPDLEAAALMEDAILAARKDGDSVGGVIGCVARNVPVGLGEPVFDRLEADLAKAMLSIPATKGFEIGSGFAGASLRGSENNDEMYTDAAGQVRTYTNSSGGVQGGISNGMPIVFRTAFKPTATIIKEQKTVDVDWNETTLASRGRHDPCVVPRAVPIVEAMTAIVLADHALRQIALNLNPELRPFK